MLTMTKDTALPVTTVLAAVAVRDADAARTFYELLLGAPPDESPMPGLTQWKSEGHFSWCISMLDRADVQDAVRN